MLKLETSQVKISIEFRQNCALVIMANVDDTRITNFADRLQYECSQIAEITEIKRYESGNATIIGVMKVGYDAKKLRLEIASEFEKIFVKPCQTTANT